jgi:hypothetical protein
MERRRHSEDAQGLLQGQCAEAERVEAHGGRRLLPQHELLLSGAFPYLFVGCRTLQCCPDEGVRFCDERVNSAAVSTPVRCTPRVLPRVLLVYCFNCPVLEQ